MNKVQRTRGVRRIIRTRVLRKAVPKYVTAGADACGRMMRESRPRRRSPGPNDSEILAWAVFDLNREILGGFWQRSAA